MQNKGTSRVHVSILFPRVVYSPVTHIHPLHWFANHEPRIGLWEVQQFDGGGAALRHCKLMSNAYSYHRCVAL
jgi:hypothetical protein